MLSLTLYYYKTQKTPSIYKYIFIKIKKVSLYVTYDTLLHYVVSCNYDNLVSCLITYDNVLCHLIIMVTSYIIGNLLDYHLSIKSSIPNSCHLILNKKGKKKSAMKVHRLIIY